MVSVLHQDHYLYTKAARWAFDEHLRRGNFEEARNYGLLCLAAYRKYKVRDYAAAELLTDYRTGPYFVIRTYRSSFRLTREAT